MSLAEQVGLALVWSVRLLGVIVLAAGLIKIVFLPVSLLYEIIEVQRSRRWERLRLELAIPYVTVDPEERFRGAGRYVPAASPVGAVPRRRAAGPRAAISPRRPRRAARPGLPLVSVIIPAYNEETVLENCVSSVLASRYPRFEVLLVDDGSSDRTLAMMGELAADDPRVGVYTQLNSGKGAALNLGIRHADGEILMFVDADGLFAVDTIERMLDAFSENEVGAVCGDDRPVNLDRFQTRLLAVTSHVGTGLVRRALSLMRCLPIVSGNVGAFRASAVRAVGGFREDIVGEDLELTWRVYRAGWQIRFQPRALVRAESPSTVRGLWKQRVRWARGLLQTLRIHRGMVGRPRYGSFGIYLAINAVNMVVVPVLQLLIVALLPLAVLFGGDVLPRSVLGVLGWLGTVSATVLVLVSIGLNRAWRDLGLVWTLIAWPLYSLLVSGAMVMALRQELGGIPARWNKLERTGVVTP